MDTMYFKRDGETFLKTSEEDGKTNATFKRNGIPIELTDKETENNSKMTDKERDEALEEKFEENIRNSVSRFINRSFKNIVVLVGAGASVVMKPEGGINPRYGKIVMMLAQDVSDELADKSYKFSDENTTHEVYSLPELAKYIKYSSNIYLDDTKKLDETFNLEDFLSKLITYIEFVDEDKDIWETSKRAIFDIIKKETSYAYDEEVFKHGRLINILSKKLNAENKLNLVTTNYDTLLEDAAEDNHYVVFDGFSFSRTPKFDDDMFEWHLSKHVSNIQTHENVYKHQVLNLLKIHGSLTWRRRNRGVVRTPKDAEGEPVMIFPSSNKYMQSYEEPYFELFSRFQGLLRLPNTLLITVGFSFSDKHITRMITQAIQHNPGLATLITDYNIDPENPSKGWEEMSRLMDDTHEIAYLRGTMNGDLTDYLGETNEYR